MNTVPVARGCPRCHGWVTRRALHPAEPPSPRFQCVPCGEDLMIADGKFVSVAYHATPETLRLLARHDHVERCCDGVVRRRGQAS